MDKKCINCKQYKPEEEYHWRKKDVARRVKCKQCVHDYDVKRYSENREAFAEAGRRYRAVPSNRDRIREVGKAYYKENIEKHKTWAAAFRKKEKGSVIYIIEVVDTHECYIGETNSYNQRIRVHKSQLSRGVHHCKGLQKRYDECGLESLVFKKLQEIEDPSTRLQRLRAEIEWLEEYIENGSCILNDSIRKGD